MQILPKANAQKYSKGQGDHVDAWLMSYADLITLLLMLFVVFVSISSAKYSSSAAISRGEPEHPYVLQHSGALAIETPYGKAYHNIAGLIAYSDVERNIALQQTSHSLSIDIASAQFFTAGTADISIDQLPLLKMIAHDLNEDALSHNSIIVAGYTDDAPLTNSPFANNWELSAMRAARLVKLLIDEGIAPARLRAVAYADNSPIVPNKDAAGNPIPENRKRNQRLVITVQNESSQLSAEHNQ